MSDQFVRTMKGVTKPAKTNLSVMDTCDILEDKVTGELYIVSKNKKGLPIPFLERITYQKEVEDLQKRLTTAEQNIEELQAFMRQQLLYNEQYNQQLEDTNGTISLLDERVTELENK